MNIGIHQPNYLPWLGLFEKIDLCDIFVFYDNVQMPLNKSFVTRNAILANNNSLWLTVPVKRDGIKIIKDVEIANKFWIDKHIKTIEHSYKFSKYFNDIMPIIQKILIRDYRYVSELNIELIMNLWKLLSAEKKQFIRASEMNLINNNYESILEILDLTEAKKYITGQGKGSMRYLDKEFFSKKGIDIKYCSSTFLEYKQRGSSFVPNLSIIDSLFNIGPEKTLNLIRHKNINKEYYFE